MGEFGGADHAEDVFDIVGYGGEDAVLACFGGVENLEGSVGCAPIWVGVWIWIG